MTNFEQLEGRNVHLPLGEVQGDQLATGECYLVMLAMNEQMHNEH